MKILQPLFLIIITILLPASIISASASTEDLPTLQILNGQGAPQEVPLKAIQDINNNIEAQEDYSVEPDNVIMVEQGKDFVLMPSEGTILKVEAIDAQLDKTPLYFADNLVKADLPSAAYILSVIVLTDDGNQYGFVTFLVVLDDGQTLTEINTQNIINAYASKDIDTRIIFEDDLDDDTPLPPPGDGVEDPSICYFDQEQPECQPDSEGNCPNDWPMNENGDCHPGGKCPDGFERVDDDETGTCYEDTIHCPGSGAIVLDEDHCAIYEPDIPPQEEEPPTTDSEETVEEIEEREQEMEEEESDGSNNEEEDNDEEDEEEDEEDN